MNIVKKSAGGVTTTNDQLLLGDRIDVRSDQTIDGEKYLAKDHMPIERVFGFTLLGTVAVSRLSF